MLGNVLWPIPPVLVVNMSHNLRRHLCLDDIISHHPPYLLFPSAIPLLLHNIHPLHLIRKIFSHQRNPLQQHTTIHTLRIYLAPILIPHLQKKSVTLRKERVIPAVALCLWVHGGVAGVPEEPDVLLVCDFGVEEVMIDFGIWAEVEEVRRDGMETWWDWVVHG